MNVGVTQLRSCSCRSRDPVQAEVLVWRLSACSDRIHHHKCECKEKWMTLMQLLNAAPNPAFAISAHRNLMMPPMFERSQQKCPLGCPLWLMKHNKVPFLHIGERARPYMWCPFLFSCPCPRNILSVPLLMRECFYENHTPSEKVMILLWPLNLSLRDIQFLCLK